MAQRTSEVAKRAARDLRKTQTEAEAKLWAILRDRRFFGKKFLRQHPIIFYYQFRERFFVADFYCHESRLVIEIDGKIHDYRKDYDQLRDHIISDLGINVVRFKNEEIDDDIDKVLHKLRQLLRV